ncbi:Trans-1,2-dihydrobenzene-1,2-diol dehydrogenase [Mizuhopecten yessoensis]|uniref:Trans-1,2-dihydrobenzene-1,2-diol dehydrogenase n=1 Tax=Mizuhopecten yessoensis TaxID=6573 RepID=A0A210QC53_MIZYE|nr:Trans-1,2-dihydrobenzene-1,2-diol dehydrogenase [Mizuhopecten yessoensis]
MATLLSAVRMSFIHNTRACHSVRHVSYGTGMDEGGCVILKYKGGGMANLTYSGRTCVTQCSASINGTKANIEIPDHFWCPEKATLPSGVVTNELPEGQHPYIFVNSGGLRYEADHARKAILEAWLREHVVVFDKTLVPTWYLIVNGHIYLLTAINIMYILTKY